MMWVVGRQVRLFIIWSDGRQVRSFTVWFVEGQICYRLWEARWDIAKSLSTNSKYCTGVTYQKADLL